MAKAAQAVRIRSESSSAVNISRTLSNPKRKVPSLLVSGVSLSGIATESASCDIDENESWSEVIIDISCGVREFKWDIVSPAANSYLSTDVYAGGKEIVPDGDGCILGSGGTIGDCLYLGYQLCQLLKVVLAYQPKA